MKQVPIRLGPLALLLAVISICLTTLSILTFTTARADMNLAEKYAETMKTRYELEAEGQAFLADMSGARADADGVVRATIEKNGSRLVIAVGPDGTIRSWRQEKEWEQDTGMGNLWAGF